LTEKNIRKFQKDGKIVFLLKLVTKQIGLALGRIKMMKSTKYINTLQTNLTLL